MCVFFFFYLFFALSGCQDTTDISWEAVQGGKCGKPLAQELKRLRRQPARFKSWCEVTEAT